MGSKQEDDFWNQSQVSSFAFDDDVDKTEEDDELDDEDNSVFNSKLEVSNDLPLRSIISTKNLELLLEDIDLPKAIAATPVNQTVQQMCLGQPHNLHCYRSLDEKLLLLDTAINTFDGNVILKVAECAELYQKNLSHLFVVLFLERSLKQALFYRHLATQPLAIQQYANYLTKNDQIQSLELLYMATGYKGNTSNVFYLSTKNTSHNSIHKKLTQFIQEHFENLRDDYERAIFTDHRKFMTYKIDKQLPSDAPITTLVHLLVDSAIANTSLYDETISEFIKLMHISEFQYEWILVNVLAARGQWGRIEDTFLKPAWFTKKTVMKSCIDLELLVACLHRHNTPAMLLESFLLTMVDGDRSLYLGRKYKCHKFVIDSLLARRDRLALLVYKAQLTPEGADAMYIEHAFRSEKRWIN